MRALVVILGLGLSLLAEAAAEAATIGGVVRDQTGLPLPGVLVEARAGDVVLAHAESARDGAFHLQGLPDTGEVDVRWTLVNFAAATRRVRLPHVPPVMMTLTLALYADVVVTGDRTFRNLADVDGTGDLVGVAGSASEGIVPARLLSNRPLSRGGDVLESVPGVLVTQHSGEGKANQYYLRGFNLDHGTDLAISVAGVPVNQPTHAHGQGYADLNFLIPELVGGIRFSKGANRVEDGDFSSAGAAHISYVNSLDAPFARIDNGQFGARRLLAAASPRVAGGTLLVAAERTLNDGPWVQADNYDRLNGLVRYTRGATHNAFSVTASVSRADWRATDQIPLRAVSSGTLSRFGFVDGSDGGRTDRTAVVAELQRGSSRRSTRATAYAVRSGLNLFSNFTYFLDDPINGDQFEQEDRRWVLGGDLAERRVTRWAGRPVETAVGGHLRHDAIGAVGLFRTVARRRLAASSLNRVAETATGTFAEAEVEWTPRLRTTLGARGDVYRFGVRGADAAATRWSGIVSPKAALAVTLAKGTEAYLNGGTGFHSNDARVIVSAADSDRDGAIHPLTRSRSIEVGLRTMRIPRVQSTVAFWRLGLDSELVFVGDAGTSEASRPSARRGVEWNSYVSVTPWLAVDGDISISRARFTVDDGSGTSVPGALERVLAAGVTLSRTRLSGALRLRHMGSRPLIEDGSVRSRASTLVSADLGVRLHRKVRLVADVFNLFNRAVSDVDYFYESRLAGEAESVADVHTHPAVPRTFRVSVQVGR